MLTLVAKESSGFYAVQSTLMYKVLKEDKDARFSCAVSFFVPGATRTVESGSVNVTVHCECPAPRATIAAAALTPAPLLRLQTPPPWWICGRTRRRAWSRRATRWCCVARAMATPPLPSFSTENK